MFMKLPINSFTVYFHLPPRQIHPVYLFFKIKLIGKLNKKELVKRILRGNLLRTIKYINLYKNIAKLLQKIEDLNT